MTRLGVEVEEVLKTISGEEDQKNRDFFLEVV